jgi:ABC-type lipoprotein release transport system permease subunit
LWEGALISLFAFVFGLLFAWLHVFFFSAGLLEPVLKGWAVLYPQFTLKPAIGSLEVASLAFFTILPFTAATIIPVWRAASADPDEVMR